MKKSNFLMKLKAYIECIKIESTLVIASSIFVGMSLAHCLNIPLKIFLFLYLIMGIGCSGGAQVLNMYFDIKVDIIEHPKRPLPKGILKPKNVLAFSILLYVFPLLSIFVEFKLFLISLFGIFLGVIYSVPKFRLREHGFLQYLILSIGYVFIPIISGWIVIKDINFFILMIASYFTLIAFFVSPIKDCCDIKGDSLYQRKTLPIRIGTKNTLLYSSISVFVISLIFLLFLVKLYDKNILGYFFVIFVLSIPLVLFILNNPKRKSNFLLAEIFSFIVEILFVLRWFL